MVCEIFVVFFLVLNGVFFSFFSLVSSFVYYLPSIYEIFFLVDKSESEKKINFFDFLGAMEKAQYFCLIFSSTAKFYILNSAFTIRVLGSSVLSI